MSFTYNLASTDTDTLNIAKVRLELGDTVRDSGVKPDGSNFSDAELQIWLDEESDSIMLATARACESLARAWNIKTRSVTAGPIKKDYGEIAKGWADMAKDLREQHGGGAKGFSAGIQRIDGYSEAAGSTEYAE